MSNPTYQEALNWAYSHIQGKKIDVTAPEFILSQRHGWSTTDLLLQRKKTMQEEEWQLFQSDIARLNQFEPAQYIVGKAPFYGRTFNVSPSVLIPESETEELVDWVLTEFQNDRPLRVLDLGTGSGVIGISLKLERPNWRVTASDISAAALTVAKQNATNLAAEIEFVESNIFNNLLDHQFDLIVTNPPYIAVDETAQMDPQVIQYEPQLALFADQQGMGFYQQMMTQIDSVLNVNGHLFGETGYKQESLITELIKNKNRNAKFETRHDISGKMRMFHAWMLS
ncbi:peptide chain release factor N(5)-glutamine methyltransferase [Paucilactobacillus kaifaensis]|uniref:peptide chain release factor N(5)-glutamine methyltransferase n=1 Tax=Paucilactobacillus kaifaensis TaxID=2559921 RepID=UPI0010F59DE5|nr:peptide chain release factor N(5)-glutamine methyltransferase [Paucilactobacillus kaifaensis]